MSPMLPSPDSNLEIIKLLDEQAKEASQVLYKLIGILDETKTELKKMQKQYRQLRKSKIIQLKEFSVCKQQISKFTDMIKNVTLNIESVLETKNKVEKALKDTKESLKPALKPVAKILKFPNGRSKRTKN